MSSNNKKNIAASVRQRLLNKARAEKRPFNELLQYYAMERFLFRLSESRYRERFVLKGALMLRAWKSPETRPTMDIDLLGITANDENNIISVLGEIIGVEVESDGIVFDPSTLQATRITENAEYNGIRVLFRGKLDSASIHMQIDIGFGDPVSPGPSESELPSVLGYPPPKLLCYSKESTIAEKFEAMLSHRELNSRMKDFYDIWLLSRYFDFEGQPLAEAIRLTLESRKTELSPNPVAFTKEFAQSKAAQWSAFRRRLNLKTTPEDFSEIVSAVETFLRPLLKSNLQDSDTPLKWQAPGPWR